MKNNTLQKLTFWTKPTKTCPLETTRNLKLEHENSWKNAKGALIFFRNQRQIWKNSGLENQKENLDLDVSKNRGTPKWMVKIMENPIKMDDLGVPLFLETPTCNCDFVVVIFVAPSYFPPQFPYHHQIHTQPNSPQQKQEKINLFVCAKLTSFTKVKTPSSPSNLTNCTVDELYPVFCGTTWKNRHVILSRNSRPPKLTFAVQPSSR